MGRTRGALTAEDVRASSEGVRVQEMAPVRTSLFGLNHSCQLFRVLTGIDRYMMKMGGVNAALRPKGWFHGL